MTYRLYIDEVGNSDLNGAATDPNVRYLALTGVLTTRALHDRIICPRIDKLKSLFQAHSPDRPLVFHRREILRREGPFAELRDAGKAETFNAELLSLLREAPHLVMTVQIDKQAHLEAYGVWHFDPYHYALRCLVERFVLYLRRHRETGDVVIEPRYKKADKKLKASFQKIYGDGTENISGRVMQAHLLSQDIGFFGKGSNVAALQMADLVAHPSARYMRFERDGIQQPDDFGSKIAEVLVDKRYARNPQTMRIEGYGTKWLP